jgi:hypothetical protein
LGNKRLSHGLAAFANWCATEDIAPGVGTRRITSRDDGNAGGARAIFLQDEFLLAATAQNLRKLAKLRPEPPPAMQLA